MLPMMEQRGDHHVSIARRKNSAWRGARMMRAHARGLGRAVAGQVLDQTHVVQMEQRLDQRDIDMLAAPGPFAPKQRRAYRGRAVPPAVIVGDKVAGQGGSSV